MKKTVAIMCIFLSVFFCSCQMEEMIPEQADTFSLFYENEELYRNAVEPLLGFESDCMISRTDYYAPDGSEDFTGLYLQDMENGTFSSCTEPSINALFESSQVKLVDVVRLEELAICAFDMCVPGRNFDYGIYYVSEDKPVYFGDPAITLVENGKGFSYEKPASYGTKFTFYTEKITDHFYYYEIL